MRLFQNTAATSAALPLAMLFLAGCYAERLTKKLEAYPELADAETAAVAESTLNEDQLRARDAELIALNNAPQKPYTINAGDEVYLAVYNHEDLSRRTVVTPDGKIGIVFLGEVEVAGLTLAEAARKIEKGLADYINAPAVGITPLSVGSETVTIGGAATHPGTYVISTGMRLSDLYAKAGGSSVRRFGDQDLDAADLVNSRFVRDGRILPVDFRLAIEKGSPVHNLILRKNDYIYIGVRSEAMVCLVGDVVQPYKKLWDNSLGLIELLASGGWMKETHWSHVVIIRGGVANPRLYRVHVDAILSGRAPNVRLEAGDVVYVPKDDVSEYNVFVRKILPTAQLFNLIGSPLMQANSTFIGNGSN